MSKKTQTSWYLASYISLLLFAAIAIFVVIDETILSVIDNPIIHAIRGNLTTTKTLFFSTVTRLGDTSTVIILTVGLALVLWFLLKNKVAAIWLVINSAIIQGAGNTALKFIFNRPRPSGEHLVAAGGTSFPSGHSMGSMLLYGTLILLLPRFIKNRTVCLISQIGLGIIILLVGTSRIYLGVHYPTDVLGGFLMGFAWLSFSYPRFTKYDTLSA